MTIHWKQSNGNIEVWFHDSDPVSDNPDRTTSREFGATVDAPPEVYHLARFEFEDSIDDFDIRRAVKILSDAAFENFQRV